MTNRMLNIGCGDRKLPGFINIDIVKGVDLRHDVTKGIPFDDNSVDCIFSEHFFEHITQRDGLKFLRECRRVLKPGGVLRIAMPDLDDLVERYTNQDWRGDGDMFRMGFEWVDNRCEMLNISMREWGHRWVYNEEELHRVALLAGLKVRGRMSWGESAIPELSGLEYRQGSKLIMEFETRTRKDTLEKPKVSILIPAYNPSYFEVALKSALAQEYENIEIIVCDDSLNDDIEHTVQAYAKDDPRIYYMRNVPPKGPLYNYVNCFEQATGEYIQFLNDDDLLDPGWIGAGVEALLDTPDVTLAVSARKYIDEQGQPVAGPWRYPFVTDRRCVVEGVSLARFLISCGRNYIGEPSACMFRREDVLDIRPHLIAFGGVEAKGLGDISLWLNLLSRGDLAYIADRNCRIRLHPKQWHRSSSLLNGLGDSWLPIRRHALRLGLYDGPLGARGLPDPVMFFSGFRWRTLTGNRRWRFGLPRAAQIVEFTYRLVRGAFNHGLRRFVGLMQGRG